jgi:hypothetical protein
MLVSSLDSVWWVVAEEEVGGGVVSAMKEKGSGSGGF